MTLKTDLKSIETLASQNSVEELSAAAKFYDKTSNLKIGEYHSDIETIQKAISLHTQSLFYAFWAQDEYVGVDGIHLYKRLWDTMKDIWSVMHSPGSIEQVIAYLKEKNITNVLTWPIHGDFLNISSSVDMGGGDWFIKKRMMTDDVIEYFEKEWIRVKVLKILV